MSKEEDDYPRLLATAHDRIRVHGKVTLLTIAGLLRADPCVVFRALSSDPTLAMISPQCREWTTVDRIPTTDIKDMDHA